MKAERKLQTNLLLVLALVAFSGCGVVASSFNSGSGISSAPAADEPVPVVVSPLNAFSLTSDQTLLKAMALEPTSGVPGDYGFDETNAGLRGQFRFDSAAKTLKYERSIASGGAWNDHTLWPVDSNGLLSYKMNQVSKISVKIRAVVNSNGGLTQCGVAFGFGDGAGHANAAGASTTLRLGNRDWATATNAQKQARDYFRLSYGFDPQNEKLVVDAPINSFNETNEWSRFSAAEWHESAGEIDVIPGTVTLAAGDEVTYFQDMEFDNAGNSITIKLHGFSSNLSTTAWASSVEKTWNYSASPTAVDGVTGSLRGGLDLPMSTTDFQNQKFNLGFVGNQQARACEFSDLKVTLR